MPRKESNEKSIVKILLHLLTETITRLSFECPQVQTCRGTLLQYSKQIYKSQILAMDSGHCSENEDLARY